MASNNRQTTLSGPHKYCRSTITVQELDHAIKACLINLGSVNRTHAIIRDILSAIADLAAMPGGGPKAADHALSLAEEYLRLLTVHRKVASRYDFHRVDCCIKSILAANRKDLVDPPKATLWRPWRILSDIDNLIPKLDGRTYPISAFLFEESQGFLRGCESRRLAKVRISVAVGHKIPPELVEMIWEETLGWDETQQFLEEDDDEEDD
ncbi:hypothetical protein B0A55_09003 [Friedmanniomyces simplex]|uniref:Uncharacterized protein n=1 Tax=Friedmanniomyces simplex TaxID=329884 RepID=A0A4U0X1G6_9PEZI|nr:hypothetical protein B0A55_09003 [Friedmanniomyces simplex]